MAIFTTTGVCAKTISFNVEDDIVKEVTFNGGCNGNLQGISSLVAGMKIDEVITRLKGIDCGGRGTSCPDQLSKALSDLY